MGFQLLPESSQEEATELPQHSRGNFLCCTAWCLLEKLMMWNRYPRALLGHPSHPPPIPRVGCCQWNKDQIMLRSETIWMTKQRDRFHHELPNLPEPQGPSSLSGSSSRANLSTRAASTRQCLDEQMAVGQMTPFCLLPIKRASSHRFTKSHHPSPKWHEHLREKQKNQINSTTP